MRRGPRLLTGVLVSGVALAAAGWAVAQEATTPPTSGGSIITLAPPAVADFWLTAEVSEGTKGPEFHGYVPDQPTLAKLKAIAGASTSGLEVAGGAPAAFGPALEFGLAALSHLSEGRFALRSNVLTIKGTAKTTADQEALDALTKSEVPDGVVLALVEVKAAADEVPENATVAAPQTSGGTATNQAVASDQPATPPAAAPAAAGAASATEPAVEAPESPMEADADNEKVGEPTAASDKTADNSPSTSAVDPAYAFSASRSAGGGIELKGMVPADAALRYFGVVAGDASTAGLTVADGAPEDFTTSAVAGLRALAELTEGTLTFADGKWSIGGKAASEAAIASARSQLAAAPDAAGWTTDIAGPPPNDICREEVAAFSATHTILFQSGSARMTDESRAALKDLAVILEKCPDATIHVEGHTDADGDENANLALSVARAEAVTGALVEEGVKDTRLYAIGYGESMPIASNDTAAGKQQNRRIVFTVLDEHK